MKNLFGINITESKDNMEEDGSVFISRQVTPQQRDRLETFFHTGEELEKKSGLSLPLDILMTICGGLGTIILVSDLKILLDKDDITLAQAYHNAPYLFYIEGICWIIFFILWAVKKIKNRKVMESEEFSDFSDDMESIYNESVSQLEIPENAVEIDVLSFRYKIKNDKEKVVPSFNFDYVNICKYVYAQDRYLCIADMYEVMMIPLESVKRIKKAKKRAMFPYWHKVEDYNSKKYKEYKITQNSQNIYYANYYIIEIEDIIGEFELYIPNYDIEIFSALTNVQTEEL
ncbi:hypothetical protein [Porcipelethomonas sp.]|uniref:hypothetical protein n=1 Tax=Porcipelethomonas sp. TaxID=2981675 RepID=UPI003EF522D5